MPAGAAGHNAHLLESAKLLIGDVHFVREDSPSVLGNASEQRVAHGPRLLENLFLHEMFVAALFRHNGVPGDVVSWAVYRASVMIHHPYALFGKYGDVAIAEEENVAGVLEQGRDIAGHKIFAVTNTNHRGRSHASGDNFLGVLGGQEH